MRALSLIFLIICGIVLSGCATGGPKRVDGELAFSPESLVTMAESFAQAGDYANALRLYQRAISENPEHLEARAGLAKTYQTLGAVDAAMAMYRSILERAPENQESLLGLGQMLVMKNRPQEALPYLEQVRTKNPANYRVYNIIGLAHDLGGQHEEAQLAYGTGLNMAPNNLSLLNNLGLSFAIQGQYAPAIRLLSKAVTRNSTNTRAGENLVMAYVFSGEEEQARKIAASFMTEQELTLKLQHYAWLKSLTSSRRAQAIFLGKTSFSEDGQGGGFSGEASAESSGDASGGDASGTLEDKGPVGAPASPSVPTDPQKRKLMEILAAEQEEQQRREAPLSVTSPEPTVSAPLSSSASGTQTGRVYRVQIGSFMTEDMAMAEWTRLSRTAGPLLSDYTPLIRGFSPEAEKHYYRLYIREIEDRALAREVCERLEEKKIGCLVIYTDR